MKLNICKYISISTSRASTRVIPTKFPCFASNLQSISIQHLHDFIPQFVINIQFLPMQIKSKNPKNSQKPKTTNLYSHPIYISQSPNTILNSVPWGNTIHILNQTYDIRPLIPTITSCTDLKKQRDQQACAYQKIHVLIDIKGSGVDGV